MRKITIAQHRKKASQADFENWKYIAGIAKTLDGRNITLEMIKKWADNPNRKLQCIFCSTEFPDDAKYCFRCMEYKGLQPSIEY